MRAQSKQGFTLLELAIVISVIGLVIGGLMVGQSLIKQSKISSLVSQFTQYSAATALFNEKYGQLPGDIDNASAYKLNCPYSTTTCNGAADNVAATPADADADGSDGDGDGDGAVEGYSSILPGGEAANFWVHLSNAQMIDGNYTVTDNCSGASCASAPDTNIPSAKVGIAVYARTDSTKLYFIAGTRGSYTASFNTAGVAGSLASNDLLPNEADAIDSKIDDGAPTRGKAKALLNLTAGTFDYTESGTCSTGGKYVLTATDKYCTLAIERKL